ncbi:hypothetical protein [Hymenobacter sp. BT491]|uniref:hypothetical protein n=1 Tax=Hymenobacter sp. BT491 TaxID=2766779 RepID=UPI001653B58F|nr:hypothetical protein [Hymenobacter sp. BT491]MBC6988562.1 hypothetical protein [Hymenobacter sp. BT491]
MNWILEPAVLRDYLQSRASLLNLDAVGRATKISRHDLDYWLAGVDTALTLDELQELDACMRSLTYPHSDRL